MGKLIAFFITICWVSSFNELVAQQDSIFQVYGSISASSTAGNSNMANAIDGDLNSSWVSNNPFPSNFFANAHQNLLLNCQTSCNSSVSLSAAVDGNTNTATPTLVPVDGIAAFLVPLTTPKTIHTIGIRLGGLQAPVVIQLLTTNGDSVEFVYSTNLNFSNSRFLAEVADVEEIRLVSAQSFYVFEIGALEKPAEEFVTLDLGQLYWLKEIKTKHWAGTNSVLQTELLIGEEEENLQLVAQLDPSEVAMVATPLTTPIRARFVRVSSVLLQQNFKKATVFEIEVYAVPDPPMAPPVVWNDDAGLYPPLSASSTVTASSTVNMQTNSPSLVIDNDFSSGWVSSNPLPDAFAADSNQNIFLGAIGQASSAIDLSATTDGNWGNMTAAINPDGTTAKAWFSLAVANVPIHRISLRLRNNFTEDVTVIVKNANQDSVVLSYPVGMSGNQRFVVELQNATEVLLLSNSAFAIQEIAAYSAPLSEYITLDLGAVKPVSLIRTRHFNGTSNAVTARLLVGVSTDSLYEVAQLDPARLEAQNILLSELTDLRFIRLEQQLVDENFKKAAVQEITVFDQNGNFGPVPEPIAQTKSFNEIFGVNTVWGWGTDKRLDRQIATEGAQLFRQVATNARNYHNLHWDTEDPDSIPNYDPNNTQVRNEWTRWTQEYADWKSVGFTPNVTYTFDRFVEARWDNPYQSAYQLGLAFGSVFGPSNENLVKAVEIGNEPWDYSDSTYSLILEGMAKGMKDADPALEVYPCALQAFNDAAGNTGVSKNYIGTKLPEAAASYLDGINLHVYSYARDASGTRIAVHPEHPESGMRGVFAGIRYRDNNLPGKEVIVTEWGWDSPSTNEFTINSESVSPISQAVYALRGLFWLSRMGVSRADWFFYANVNLSPNQQPNNHDRSGLTESKNFNFNKKRSFNAVAAMQNRMGHLYFDEVLREDEGAYIYALRDSTGAQTHLIAWRPVVGDDTANVSVPFEYPLAADSAWFLSGLSPQGELVNVNYANGFLDLPLSSKPLLIQLGPVQSNKKGASKQAQLAVKVCPESQMVAFELTFAEPTDYLGIVELQKALAPIGRDLYWYQELDSVWKTTFCMIEPGVYETAAILSQYFIQTNTVGFEIPKLYHLQVTPNPNAGLATVTIAPERQTETLITVWSLEGRLLKSVKFPAFLPSVKLPLHDLPPGNYILRATTEDWVDQLIIVKI